MIMMMMMTMMMMTMINLIELLKVQQNSSGVQNFHLHGSPHLSENLPNFLFLFRFRYSEFTAFIRIFTKFYYFFLNLDFHSYIEVGYNHQLWFNESVSLTNALFIRNCCPILEMRYPRLYKINCRHLPKLSACVLGCLIIATVKFILMSKRVKNLENLVQFWGQWRP